MSTGASNPLVTFVGDQATGGCGGSGGSGSTTPGVGGTGGNASGGALYDTGGTTLVLGNTFVTGNLATAGGGGKGGAGTGVTISGAKGGTGGNATGGGLYLTGVTSATLTLYSVSGNIAWAGAGGTGGSGSGGSSPGGAGGAGGNGGLAQGGGIYTSGSTVTDNSAHIIGNIAYGGTGGTGGLWGIGTRLGAMGPAATPATLRGAVSISTAGR